MSDSEPFTIIRGNERNRVGSGTFTFDEPAPANSVLRFSAIGKVRINGQEVDPQAFYNFTHFSSYQIPIAEGATSISYQGFDCSGITCSMKDVSIFSLTNGVESTPTNTLVPTATNTALPTSTNTPLPTATNTPVPTPTNTPVPQDVCHAAIYRNGVLEMGPEIICPE